MWQLLYYNWDVRFVGLYAARSYMRNINSLCPGPDGGTLWHWNSNPALRCNSGTQASNLIIHEHRSNIICHFTPRRMHWTLFVQLDSKCWVCHLKDKSISLFRLLQQTNSYKARIVDSVVLWLPPYNYLFSRILSKQKSEEEGFSFQIDKINVGWKRAMLHNLLRDVARKSLAFNSWH